MKTTRGEEALTTAIATFLGMSLGTVILLALNLAVLALTGCASTPPPTSPDPAIFKPRQSPVYVPPYYDDNRRHH